MLIFSTTLLIALGIALVSYRVQLKQASSKIEELTRRNRRLSRSQKNLYQNLKSLKSHPDLDSARSISLDYLRVMMTDDIFRNTVLTQLKQKLVRDLLPLLRHDADTALGIPRKSRLVDCAINIRHRMDMGHASATLFRVKLRIYRHPEVKASSIVQQLFYVISNFLSPDRRDLITKAKLFGYASHVQWDSESKPTPSITLYQDSQYNVTMRGDAKVW
jgi:hypothetical protein